MLNFKFQNITKIIFGKDTELGVGKEVILAGGKKVLLHYGGGSIIKTGLYDRVRESLAARNISVTELGGVQPNPRVSLVREGIRLCRQEKIDLILAVGGGSVIDSAKAIAAGVHSDCDIWDYFIGIAPQPLAQALPVGVVLTIPAAGSESSASAVITNEEGHYKRPINSPLLIPRFAVLNPELTYTLPPYQTACGAADIAAHLMERYFTTVESVDLTDRLIEGSIRTVLHFAPLALREPHNYDARAEVMWAGTLAHNGLLDTGRTGDWASHDIEHELSGLYDIAHGAGLSILFPAWMKYVYPRNPAKFIQFAVRVFDVDLSYTDTDAIVLEMIRRLENWYQSMGLPIRLKEAGIDETHLQDMAEKAMENREFMGNYYPMKAEDIYEIFRLALE